MATATLVHTFTGTEGWATFASGSLPAFVGSFTISATLDRAQTQTQQFTFFLVDATSTCYQSTIAFNMPGPLSIGPLAYTVNVPPTAWSCTDWNVWALQIYTLQFYYPAPGSVLTVTITYPDPVPPTPCQYGTQPKSGTSLVLPVSGALVDLVLAHFSKSWLTTLFGSIIGTAMDMDKLCRTIPPSWPAINIFTLLVDDLQKLVLFQALAWHVFCECAPGPTTPTPFTPPDPVEPPNWPAYGPYTCTNSDICATLLEILNRLDHLSESQHVSISNTTTINQGNSLRYQLGAVHSGLSGTGTLSIAGLLGVRLELTSGIPGVELEGNPPYIWDVGWQSVSDGGAMLQERRITRASAEWFPSEMQLATLWGFFFKGGTVATMTELVPIGA